MTDTTYGPGDTLPDIALETIDGSEVIILDGAVGTQLQALDEPIGLTA